MNVQFKVTHGDKVPTSNLSLTRFPSKLQNTERKSFYLKSSRAQNINSSSQRWNFVLSSSAKFCLILIISLRSGRNLLKFTSMSYNCLKV